MPDKPYADPQDLQFGKAAKEKEETLDARRERGESEEHIVEEEQARQRAGAVTEPRPGNKARPGGD
jgi:hypothetical protein